MGDIYLWRQVFILVTNMLFAISTGHMYAFPSVIIPALSTNSTRIEGTANQVSWIVPSNGIGALLGFFVSPPILQMFGRKVVHIVDCLFLLIGWIIIILSQNISAFLAARVIQGFAVSGIVIHNIILSEYSAPNRRGCFIIIKKASTICGALMFHSLSLIWNWQQMATFAIIFPTLSILLTPLWPESPSYLAMKGRFKESEKSFIWLHGDSKLEELSLLHSQQQKAKKLNTEKWHKFLFKRDFMKPFVIVCSLTVIMELSGKHYIVVYVVQMMMELVGDKSLAIYYSIGADLFTVLALMLSCLIISCFNRRTVLFTSGVSIVSLMLIICVVVLLKLSSVPWLAPSLIVLHIFLVNVSIIPVSNTLLSELLPLEHKGWGLFFLGIVFSCTYTLLLKTTPSIIQSTGVGGLYATYGITIAVCMIILHFILPETKNRTLAEIENEFNSSEMSIREDSKRLHMND